MTMEDFQYALQRGHVRTILLMMPNVKGQEAGMYMNLYAVIQIQSLFYVQSSGSLVRCLHRMMDGIFTDAVNY